MVILNQIIFLQNSKKYCLIDFNSAESIDTIRDIKNIKISTFPFIPKLMYSINASLL